MVDARRYRLTCSIINRRFIAVMETSPTYQFFIPSVYDDTALHCRIYSLPDSYFGGGSELHSEGAKPWTPKGAYCQKVAEVDRSSSNGFTLGAIVAHPYTSLGGSYDDSTVLHVVRELMKKGFTVGTFNFRYAQSLSVPHDGRASD